jgi:hypothetical protein
MAESSHSIAEADAPFHQRVARFRLFGSWSQNLWQAISIAIVGIVYLLSLTPSHAIIPDDYAAYIMHASNLVHGRPYADIKFIPNPDALWIGPVEGYPPVYPLLLAPIYKVFGLNLWAMKVVTVLCFLVFLAVFLRLTDRILPSYGWVCLIILISFNGIFREYGNYILSEMPYLMFSFAALLMIDISYWDLDRSEWRLRKALFAAILIYCAYGTRTIGIALLPAIVLADLFKFKKPSRFLCVVSVMAAALIELQMILLGPPRTYLKLTDFAPSAILAKIIFYGKVLSYVWQNGASKDLQIVFAVVATSLAVIGFWRSLWHRRSATEFYLLIYFSILMVYAVDFGLRALLPILPQYFAYALKGFSQLTQSFNKPAKTALACLLALVIVLTYLGNFRQGRIKRGPDTKDPAFEQLCAFIKNNTRTSEVVVFAKPRSLTLFTDRASAFVGPDDTPAKVARFLKSVHASIVVVPNWQRPSWDDFIRRNGRLIFQNSVYIVLRVKFADQADKDVTSVFKRPSSKARTSSAILLLLNQSVLTAILPV